MTTKAKVRPLPNRDPVPCWQATACPFCGWVPSIQPYHGGAPTKVLIACDSERCYVAPSVTGETKRQALHRWNRRVQSNEHIVAVQKRANARG